MLLREQGPQLKRKRLDMEIRIFKARTPGERLLDARGGVWR
jgi:hypothetical protein